MSKKVSNIATRETIEKEFGHRFKFPKLYRPSEVIDGTEESTLSIITGNGKKEILYAIWGLLPDDYEDDWKNFQDALDTLSIDENTVDSYTLFHKSIEQQRCLIIVTGYFIYHLHKGTLYPYYVHHKRKQPFCLAGIYTHLEDGFITCSFLKHTPSGFIDEVQNVDNMVPIPIAKEHFNAWLNPSTPNDEVKAILEGHNEHELEAHPIAKEFFKNGISYETMLEPVDYKGIPKKNLSKRN